MVLMLLSANGADWLRWAAVAVFVIASISDFLDGYIAGHYNQVSDFGKFLDPLADKLLVTACMMIFVGWGRMPSWVVFIVIAREFAISGLRMVAASNGTVIAAGWSGKIKTSCTMVGLIAMMDAAESSDAGSGREYRHSGHNGLFRRGVFLQKLGLPRSCEQGLTFSCSNDMISQENSISR